MGDMVAAFIKSAVLAAALAVHPAMAGEAAASGEGRWRWADAGNETVQSLAAFGGEGTERNLSDTIENLLEYEGSTDRALALAFGRRIAWYDDRLSIDGEILYARHYGRERYHEFGVAAYLRWHDFPWDEILATSAAVGMGPSYTTIHPQLERTGRDEDRSRTLNQFNIEMTAALPEYRHTEVLARLQHRSGMFGTINGVWDASNFLMLGVRHSF